MENIERKDLFEFDERRAETPVGSKIIQNSITASYQKYQWLELRVLLDGIQNHLPADSGGDKFDIEFFSQGKWRRWSEIGKFQDSEIKAVRFWDNGPGFVADELSVLSSSKAGNTQAAGLFGEGLKMISAACLRLGIGIFIESKYWRAVPCFNEVQLTGRSEHRLEFHVFYFRQPIFGSRTTFYHLTPKFIELIRNIEEYVLPLQRERYKPVFRTPFGDIIGPGKTQYVKGLWHTPENLKTIFSYNFLNISDVKMHRDRDLLDEGEFRLNAINILKELDRPELIEEFCRAGIKAPIVGAEIELTFLAYFTFTNIPLFREAIKKICGSENIALVEQTFAGQESVLGKRIKYLESRGYFSLNVEHWSFRNFLHNACGFPYTCELLSDNEFSEETVATSFTLDYEEKRWKEERILLDILQNHWPTDSGGEIKIEVRIEDRGWVEIRGREIWHLSMMPYPEKEILELRISDNGCGFDSKLLNLTYSTKDGDATIGMHGEGLKMISAACLRLGMSVRFASQNWVAHAFERSVLCGKNWVRQLCFKVEKSPLQRINGSETWITNLTPEFAREISKLRFKVIALEKESIWKVCRILDKTSVGEIIDIDGETGRGHIFVKGFKVADEKDALLFSYNFYDNEGFDSRDRDIIDIKILAKKVSQIIRELTNVELLKTIISRAEIDWGQPFKLEFQKHALALDKQELWKKAFYECFGENAVLATEPSATIEARFIGFIPIVLRSEIAQTLLKAGVLSDKDVAVVAKFEVVANENLTQEEKKVFAKRELIDKTLGVRGDVLQTQVIIFEQAYRKDGSPLDFILGLWNPAVKKIYIKRSRLKVLKNFLMTYLEERGHELSRAADYDRRFVNFIKEKFVDLILANENFSKPENR